MVRRVGFGGDQSPNKRDAELRQAYHKVDGNHSDRAHDAEENAGDSVNSQQSAEAEQSKRPKRKRRAPVIIIVILFLWLAMLGKAFLDVLVQIRYDYDIVFVFFLVIAIPLWLGPFFILRRLLRRNRD